ncbi:MAG: aminotransferase class I/II-fold pyridoxal phosphate-dependent enzyme [Laribacter sp.]|nr:aminotransferase class I/II-fold pyridoxal phosphate-dependent enzyme [Laribacter sp.]MBP9526970.1 aminotransferase class I/II-fold pyridoxal phosphate-dependent enzyme [Laribacter sp.]
MDRRTLLKSGGLLVSMASLAALPSKGYAAALAASDKKLIGKVPTPSASAPVLLNFNENSLGMSPKATQAIQAALPEAFRYPDAARGEVIATLAKVNGVKPDMVSLGNGSSECIKATVHAFGGPDVQLVVPDPTFDSAEVYAKSIGMKVVKVRLNAAHQLDIPAMKKAVEAFPGKSLVYLCNPNNPTATITPDSEIAPWINSAPASVTFLFDEAYHEYVTDPRYQSAVKWVQAGKPNVIVTRTFSKIHALAGLRIGYTLAAPATTAHLNESCSIDNTNIAAAVAANASLQDTAFIQRSLQATALARQITTKALDELGLEYLPSQANFMLHRVKGSSAAYREEMKKRHVMVGRPFDHYDGWNRLTLGTPGEMTAFVAVLKDMRRQGLV